jgi:hypothetical protein
MTTIEPNGSLVVSEISIDEEFIDTPKSKIEQECRDNLNQTENDSTPTLYENRFSIEKSNVIESKLFDSISSPTKPRGTLCLNLFSTISQFLFHKANHLLPLNKLTLNKSNQIVHH